MRDHPSKTTNKDPPVDGSSEDNAVQDTWEPGLRRRRGGARNSTNNENNENNDDGIGGNNETQRQGNNFNGRRIDGGNDRTVQNNSPSQMHGTPGPTAAGGGGGNYYAAGIGPIGTPSCGNGGVGGGAVGILTSPTAGGGGTLGTFEGAPSTPYKTPTKDDAAGGLVAATPSSITTAGETAESTVLSQSPLRIHRRSRRGRSNSRSGGSPATPSLRRQYQLLRSQILLLLGSSMIGLVLFLFYALPLAAFVSLALMVSSMGALVPVAGSILRARYELEMDDPMGLTRYLPDSVRVLLTETSLHDFMTDNTFFMENRYLLLYFMPGLQPEQLMNFIDQLPPRHREALLQPGLGRLMPSVMENLVRLDNDNRGNTNAELLPLENGDGASIASGLTVDQEHQGEGGEIEGAEAEVTLLDAVTGLRRTLATFAFDNGGSGGDEAPTTPVGMPSATPVAHIANEDTTPANVDENYEENNQDDDNSSIDFSIDLNVQELTNMLPNQNANEAPVTPASSAPINNSELRNVIVELHPNQNSDQNDEEVQQEYDLEGQILSEAASAAVANYAAQASTAARETASEAVATTSSWFIRAGTLTGLIAGGGGIVAAVSSNGSTSRLFVNLGTLSGSIRTADSASSSSRGTDESSGDANAAASERWIHGLFATSAFGFASAGFAYLIRNRVRAEIAANREKRLKDEQGSEDIVDKS
ncbi:hypothetical protein ACHAXR_010733 [Thalassiosira sp. AJA248-18]